MLLLSSYLVALLHIIYLYFQNVCEHRPQQLAPCLQTKPLNRPPGWFDWFAETSLRLAAPNGETRTSWAQQTTGLPDWEKPRLKPNQVQMQQICPKIKFVHNVLASYSAELYW